MANPNVRFTWNGPKVAAVVRVSAFEGLKAAGGVLMHTQKATVGQKGAPVPGQPPKLRTGRLQLSMQSVADPAAQVVRVGTNDPRGRWLEFGVTVRPKRAKMLAIPLNRKSELAIGRTSAQVKSLRSLGVKFAKVRSKAGNIVLLEKTPTGKIKKNGLAFVLKDFVRISKRPWLWVSYKRARSAMTSAFRTTTRLELDKKGLGIK